MCRHPNKIIKTQPKKKIENKIYNEGGNLSIVTDPEMMQLADTDFKISLKYISTGTPWRCCGCASRPPQ